MRSHQFPMGLADLRPGDAAKVRDGNALLSFVVGVLLLCARLVLPASLENPRSSRVWLTPPWQSVARLRCCRSFVTDFCMWGKPWRKSTIFAAVHLNLEAAFEGKRCLGARRGLCARTGQPHICLSGFDKEAKAWRTKIAEPYPGSLCKALAKSFEDRRLELRYGAFARLALH